MYIINVSGLTLKTHFRPEKRPKRPQRADIGAVPLTPSRVLSVSGLKSPSCTSARRCDPSQNGRCSQPVCLHTQSHVSTRPSSLGAGRASGGRGLVGPTQRALQHVVGAAFWSCTDVEEAVCEGELAATIICSTSSGTREAFCLDLLSDSL